MNIKQAIFDELTELEKQTECADLDATPEGMMVHGSKARGSGIRDFLEQNESKLKLKKSSILIKKTAVTFPRSFEVKLPFTMANSSVIQFADGRSFAEYVVTTSEKNEIGERFFTLKRTR